MASHHEPLVVGRYLLHRKIARGGMATIHIARLIGDVGFSRIVAAKRMHPELVEDREFVAMFLDEARIASKVHHRNVVPVLDVVTLGDEIMLVQEYIHGAPLSLLLHKTHETHAHVPVPVAAAIACHTLAGLHAAHETVDEMGTPLHIVHRDVSPQNILVGNDGTARIVDFGIAKASLTSHITRKGIFKGKLGYSSPEQLRGEATRQSDVYALGVVLWELLAGQRLHPPQGEAELVAEIMSGEVPSITSALEADRTWIGPYRWGQLEALEPIVRKALDPDPRRRWQTAADMEEAINAAVPIASSPDIAAWLRAVGKELLEQREKMIAEEEASWRRASSSSTTTLEPGAATDPDGVFAHGYSLFGRGPTVLVAALLVLVAASVAFLLRDLAKSRHAPPAVTAPPAAVAATVVEQRPSATPAIPIVTRPVEAPPAARNISFVSMTLPEEESEQVVEEEPSEAPRPHPVVKQKRSRSSRESARVHAVPPARAPAPPPPARAVASPPPPPPVRAPAPTKAAGDCSPPFYFEGTKKIFKAGCL